MNAATSATSSGRPSLGKAPPVTMPGMFSSARCCIDDVNNPEKLAETYRWQIRDRPVRVREVDNGGYGDMESIILGEYPGVRFILS